MTYSPPAPFDTLFTDQGYSGTYGTDWGGKASMASINGGRVVPDSADIANLEALYDGEIAFVDRNIGRLVTVLREHDLTSNTWFIITADHGEEFYEHHGIGHGHTLYQELISIPLIIAGPGINQDADTNAVAAQIDVLPTVLSICGFEVPEWTEGQDILSSDRNSSVRDVFSSFLTSFGPWVAVRRGDAKLHWIQGTDASMQFDLENDPQEASMLAEVDSTLLDSAFWYWATPPAGHPSPVDMEQAMINALRGLGYL
ncbi:MAG: sulfatase-like hydrolase/transferase [Candidatus Fermentibacteraceae bacterium]